MEMEKVKFSPPDGGYGWIIIIACILINSSLYPLMQCFGIIYETKFQEMGISAAEISFLLHFHNSVMCGLGLLSGPILRKYDYRRVSLVGCFLACLGVFLTSFADSYAFLIVTIGILIGTGQGILLPSTSLAINSYFKKNLTIAMSLSVTGVGLIPIFMPQICNLLLNIYGIKGTVLIMAGIAAHSFVGALLLRPIKRSVLKPNRISQNTERAVSQEAVSEKLLPLPVYQETTTPIKIDQNNMVNKICRVFNLELFKERVYVIIIIGMGISFVAELNFVLMTPFVLSELANFIREDVALALSIQATADIAGRLIIPLLAHRSGWPPKLMYAVSLIGSSIGRTILAFYCDIKNIVFLCNIILGLSKGTKAVFQSLILPNYITLERLPAAMGLLMVFNGLLSLIIGPFIGVIHDISNSYTNALHTTTIMSLFCVVLWAADDLINNKKSTGNSNGET